MLNKIKKLKLPMRFRAGASLIEVAVAIVLLAVIVVIFGTVFLTFRLANEASYRSRASALAEAGLDALRSAGATIINDQTDGPFLGTFINQGSWSVFATGTAPSGANALKETSSSPEVADISGLLVLSSGAATSTIEASVLWTPENPASGTAKIGIALRGSDAANGYFYSIGPANIILEKRNDGSGSTLFSQSGTYSPGVWHKLKIAASASSFSLYYNDILIGTASDPDFTEGDIALFSEYALASADSISISGDTSLSLNFDSDAAGTLPESLKRLGFGDLPEGRGTLTIEDAYAGETSLKKATVKVYWFSPQGEKNVEASTLIQM